jgi:DNA-directed RNA polymerase specialized sigma24 family protein
MLAADDRQVVSMKDLKKLGYQTAHNYMRRELTYSNFHVDDENIEARAELQVDTASIPQLTAHHEAIEFLRQLNEPLRTVAILMLHGHTQPEIAQEMAVSVGKVNELVQKLRAVADAYGLEK